MPDPGNEANSKPSAEKKNVLAEGLKYVHIGFILPACVIGGWLLGGLMDRWLGTTSLYLVGLGLGIVAGFYDLIRTVIRMNKELK
ncbi:MAG TPA: AtpZ/AtpI family protein [Terriglobales bacterium]|nr:AtpZ/AtpI family protein [Terriglobales bacterium]